MARRRNLAAVTHSSARIAIGPYLIRSPENDLFAPGFHSAGWALELAGDAFATRVNIYRKTDGRSDQVELTDFLVPLNQIPFRVGLLPRQPIAMRAGTLVPLEAVLVSLYQDHEVARGIESFLPELCRSLAFHNTAFESSAVCPGELLVPKATDAGFQVVGFWQYHRSLYVRIGWEWAKASRSHSAKYYYAGTMEFRPTPARTLGKGKWSLPMQTTIYYLLFQKLCSLFQGDPQNWLTLAGHQTALNHYKWTKVNLMTRAELKQARLEFVRQNPHLHSQPRELARALREAELYAEHTELGAILRQLPRMLEEAD
jgi:hypothetical protein